MRANRGELLIRALAFCLVLILGLSVAVAPTWAQEAVRYYNDGVTYSKKGQYDAAIASYKRAIRLKPGYVNAHYNIGLAYHKKGQYDLAIASYKRAIRLKPGHVGAHVLLGLAYASKGDRKAALVEYEWLKTRWPRAADDLLTEIKKIFAK